MSDAPPAPAARPAPAAPPTSDAPRLEFALPGTWLQLDPARPQLTRRRIAAYTEGLVGKADDAAIVRDAVSSTLLATVDYLSRPQAKGAELQTLLMCSSVAPPTPSPVTIAVYLPQGVSMTPSPTTDPHDVLTTFETAMDALAVPLDGHGSQRGVAQDARPGYEEHPAEHEPPARPDVWSRWTRHRCADGLALTRWRVTTQSIDPRSGQTIDLFCSEHWRTIPGSRRMALIQVSSPLARIPDVLHRLARAFVATTRVAPAGPIVAATAPSTGRNADAPPATRADGASTRSLSEA